jgi:hypothetical protein
LFCVCLEDLAGPKMCFGSLSLVCWLICPHANQLNSDLGVPHFT